MECPQCKSTNVTSTGDRNVWQCWGKQCAGRKFNRDVQALKLGIIPNPVRR